MKSTTEPTFTQIEVTVMSLLFDDHSIKQVAAKIRVSKAEVDRIVAGLVAKTNSRSEIGVIKYMISHGILSL